MGKQAKFYIGDKVYAPHIGTGVYTIIKSPQAYQLKAFDNKEPIFPIAIGVNMSATTRPAPDLTAVTRTGKLTAHGEPVIYHATVANMLMLLKRVNGKRTFETHVSYITFNIQGIELNMPDGTTIRQAIDRIEEMNLVPRGEIEMGS